MVTVIKLTFLHHLFIDCACDLFINPDIPRKQPVAFNCSNRLVFCWMVSLAIYKNIALRHDASQFTNSLMLFLSIQIY